MLRRLLLLVVVLAALAGAVTFWISYRLNTPFRGFTAEQIFVDLPPGTSVSQIASRLATAGVVPDALTFRIAARLAGDERRLQAGEYRFAEAATPKTIVARLVKGDVFSRTLTVPEGLTAAEIATLFERAGLGSANDFRKAARNSSLVSELDPEARSLEGYLFPDTYALPRTTGAEDTVQAMVARFNAAFDVDLRTAAAEQHLGVRELVTLASIIEKETGRSDERPLVAAVYRNRLRIGMPLQCDPTVIYAKMLAGTWRGNLTRADLELDSPYNTYRYPGLPPGPIASPGRASLDAALHPADVPYLFFVSRNDGSHVFATSLAEHNENVARYQRQGQRAKGKGQR